MAKKTAKEIVEEQMPEMEIVEAVPVPVSDSVRSKLKPGPSMADLRKKYLGATDEDDSAADEAGVAAAPDEGDVEVKTVRPKHSPADPANDPGPRAVIISKKRGMIGGQG